MLREARTANMRVLHCAEPASARVRFGLDAMRSSMTESRSLPNQREQSSPRPVIPGGAVCCQSPLRRVLGRDQMRLKVSSPPSITVSSKRLA